MKNIYLEENSEYKKNNPSWHVEDSPWKAQKILELITKNNLQVNTVAEIGCGFGEILNQLYFKFSNEVIFSGYDISEDAYIESISRSKERLQFYKEDLLQKNVYFDLLLMIDVFEHVDDYLGFIRASMTKSNYCVFHIPLDLSISSIARGKLIDARRSVGHIHYFSKETALATIEHCNLEIIDYIYTDGAISLGKKLKTRILNIFRKLFFNLNKDFAVRLFGGYSLMVLAKKK